MIFPGTAAHVSGQDRTQSDRNGARQTDLPPVSMPTQQLSILVTGGASFIAEKVMTGDNRPRCGRYHPRPDSSRSEPRSISHMKTTLNIDDTVMAELKREAARQGRTMSELVESALRLLLRSHHKQNKLVPLPTFHSGGAHVDIADRDALYQAMEGR